MRTYSVFVNEGTRDKKVWTRITPLAYGLSGARKLFQGILLSGSLSGRWMELRPAEQDMERAAEYEANRNRIFPKENTDGK